MLLLLAASAVSAQGVDPAGLGARRDTLRLADGAEIALAPRVVPGSFAATLLRLESTGLVPVRPLDAAEYRLDAAAGRLTLVLPDSLLADPALWVAVAYRALDLGLRDVYTRRVDSTLVPPAALPGAVPTPRATAEDEALFGDMRLQRSGSITRGLIAGSNRDLAVESGLRMELAGEVAEGVTVEAVLTDASTPILPEGTTQQLSEFDRVYVRVATRGTESRLGDVDLALTGTRFADLSRRVQGAAVEARFGGLGPLAGGRVLAAGAATRGLFRSQAIAAVEGVQGPYRLTGASGETFVLVVPNSERVYLDGVLLERGENADYVIDYATGELTFTPRRLITSERRITVDFEYSAGGFTRPLLAASAEARLFMRRDSTAGLRLTARAMREGDAAGLDLGLSAAELDAISNAGGRDVLVPGEERVVFDPESPFVLYTRRDTVFAGQTYRVFVPATAQSDSVFQVRFTRVETGTGSYRRAGAIQNGLRYEWAGPTGGDYIPFRRLPRPEQRSVFDLRAEAAPLPGLDAWAEWAASAYDRNTLSSFDPLGAGQAIEAGATLRPLTLGRAGALDGRVRVGGRAAAFAPLDRTRAVDFGRTWNLDRTGTSTTAVDTLAERIAEAELGWALTSRSSLRVEGGALGLDNPQGGRFRATRGAVVLGLAEPTALGGFLPELAYRLDYAASDDALTADTLGVGRIRGTFLRQRGRVARGVAGGRLVPSVDVEAERRAQRGPDGRILGGNVLTDTTSTPFSAVLPASYGFLSLRPGLAWTAGALTASAAVEARTEAEPLDGALQTAAQAVGAEAEARWRPGGAYSAEGRLAFRRRSYREEFRALGREDAESLALRWSARAAPLRRAVETTATYEALTERAPLLQETYVLVGPEIGTHVWRDGAGEPRAGEPDGVAQVDEFFPETTPLEGSYARTYVPGDQLFPVVGVQAQLRLRLDPSRLIARTVTGTPARIARALTLQTTIDLRERTRERDLLRVLLLDPGVLQSPGASGDSLSGTLAGRFRLQQDLGILQDDPRRGVRFSFSTLSTTSRLAAGLERRRLLESTAEGRLASSRLGLRVRGGWSRDRSASDAFATRTFDLATWRVEPEATWTPAPGRSLTLGVVLATKTNALALAGQPTGATLLRLPVEARLTRTGRLALTLRAERADVRLNGGVPGGLVEYELTEGRGPGVSYLWGVIAEYTLTRYLRASAFYDGRAPADAPVIHTFRMQIGATF
ncbi:MAG TPA: hypothetical protein VK610_00475 [Rhodothermales bacterium]|nr:hypothetical protein [Rhodothermales bacterium]